MGTPTPSTWHLKTRQTVVCKMQELQNSLSAQNQAKLSDNALHHLASQTGICSCSLSSTLLRLDGCCMLRHSSLHGHNLFHHAVSGKHGLMTQIYMLIVTQAIWKGPSHACAQDRPDCDDTSQSNFALQHVVQCSAHEHNPWHRTHTAREAGQSTTGMTKHC